MCIARDRVSSYKASKNKARLLAKIKKESTFKDVGDDTLRYFTDGSILIHRKIVDELKTFKTAD